MSTLNKLLGKMNLKRNSKRNSTASSSQPPSYTSASSTLTAETASMTTSSARPSTEYTAIRDGEIKFLSPNEAAHMLSKKHRGANMISAPCLR
ncbi:hypothetical protein BGZ83_011537 [Gryganskiella cystojenkinii]|nr:hypothetical protein BGZ83_011537 [Gryganskiella cystojenkinii]